MDAGTDVDIAVAKTAAVKQLTQTSQEMDAINANLPTPEELKTLRRVSGKVPWTVRSIPYNVRESI